MAEAEARSVPVHEAINDLNSRLAPFDNEIFYLDQEGDLLNLSPQIQGLRRQIRELAEERSALPRGSAEWAEVNTLRNDLLDKLAVLKTEFRGTARQRGKIRRRLRALRNLSLPLRNRLKNQENRLAEIRAELPEGVVHPGNLNTQNLSRSDGHLSSLGLDMSAFISSTPRPRPAPRARGRGR